MMIKVVHSRQEEEEEEEEGVGGDDRITVIPQTESLCTSGC